MNLGNYVIFMSSSWNNSGTAGMVFSEIHLGAGWDDPLPNGQTVVWQKLAAGIYSASPWRRPPALPCIQGSYFEGLCLFFRYTLLLLAE